MANKIILKKSSVITGGTPKSPVGGDLDYGELAINYGAGRLYYKRSDNAIDYFESINSTTTSYTKSITLTTNWQDTGINGTDLATGTYIVQLYANDTSAGGTSVNEYYSGIMSWWSGTTNESVELPSDEIPLHRAGGSSNAGLYLRTYRPGNNTVLKLQIYSNQANTSAANYVFKFRRFI